LENNYRQPENPTENKQSDSLDKSQFTLSYGVDEGGGLLLLMMMMGKNQSS
jgi:hypothetical protein